MNNSYRFKRIVVKVGSNVLTRPDGTLDTTRMSALTDQLAALHRAGVEVILVSSGAVASGRNELKTQRKLDSVSARQLFSAVGQVKLINHYYELFREYGITCGQVLTTKENFSTRRHYLNQQHCMSVMLENGVIPIVNENDTISLTELMFTDNDELSGLIAAMMDVEALFSNMKVGTELVQYVIDLVNRVYSIVNYSGVQMLIFLAGLQSISPSIYEACQIEGATSWETFWKITFPMISPMILVNGIYTIIDSFTRADNVAMAYITQNLSSATPEVQAMGNAQSWMYFGMVILVIAAFAGIASLFVFYQKRD